MWFEEQNAMRSTFMYHRFRPHERFGCMEAMVGRFIHFDLDHLAQDGVHIFLVSRDCLCRFHDFSSVACIKHF